MYLIERLSTVELFELKAALAKMDIFGPWTQDAGYWRRPEPGTPLEHARVVVWLEHGCDRPGGWYWRCGFGVLCIPGVNSTEPYQTAEEAMRAVDKELKNVAGLIVVNPS